MPMPPTNQEARCLCRCLISCGLDIRLCPLVLASRFEGSLDAGVRWAAGFLWVGDRWKWLESVLTEKLDDFVSRDLERREALVLLLPSFDRVVVVKERPNVDPFLLGSEDQTPTRHLINGRTTAITNWLRWIQNCVSRYLLSAAASFRRKWTLPNVRH